MTGIGAAGPTGVTGSTGPDWTLSSLSFNANGNLNITSSYPQSLTTTAAAWLVGGNTLSATGIFGTLSNNNIDFYTNNAFRGRWLNTGAFLINSNAVIAPASTGDPLQTYVTSNTNVWAADGINTSNSGGGLFAENTATGNSYNALEGISAYTGTTYVPSGVFGLHINTSGAGYGGSFTTNSSNGGSYGLYAQMPTGSSGLAAYFSGDINVTGTYFNISDATLKENIHSAAQMMEKLKQINVYTYNFKDDIRQNYGVTQGTSIGLLAQEVEAVFPQLVKTTHLVSKVHGTGKDAVPDNSKEVKAVSYMGLIPVLLEGIKEQQNQIEALQKKLDEMNKAMHDMQEQLPKK